MTEFEAEMERLLALDDAVRMYLSHLWEFEQGVGDGREMDEWRERLQALTSEVE